MIEHIGLPPEIVDILPEDCVECPVARFAIQRAMATATKPEGSAVDPMKVARSINSSCDGWKDSDSLPANIVAVNDPAEVIPEVIEQNCSYSHGVPAPEIKQ